MKNELDNVNNSFLIVYQNIFDFCDFKTFKLFKTFEERLRNSNEELGFYLLKKIFRKSYDDLCDGFLGVIDQNEGLSNNSIKYNLIKLFNLAEISDEDYIKSLDKVYHLSSKYSNILYKNYPSMKQIICLSKIPDVFLNNEQKEFYDKWKNNYLEEYYSEDFENDIKNDIEKISKQLQNGLKEKGYEIRAVWFKDQEEETVEENDQRLLLEFKFIPFLKMNPEKKYEIIIYNEI